MGFREELEQVINRHSMENGSDTPDFILSEYMADCLTAFDKAVARRERWYGRTKRPLPALPDQLVEEDEENTARDYSLGALDPADLPDWASDDPRWNQPPMAFGPPQPRRKD